MSAWAQRWRWRGRHFAAASVRIWRVTFYLRWMPVEGWVYSVETPWHRVKVSL